VLGIFSRGLVAFALAFWLARSGNEPMVLCC
jgi:hypothetical protein